MKNSHSDHSYITSSISLAITSYMLFTFVIGFTSISVGWVVNYVSEIYIIIFALVPMIFYLFFHKLILKYPISIVISVILWATSTFIPIIEIKYILILIGIFFTLISFRLLLITYLHNSTTFSSKIFVISLIFIDQILKAFNQGQIPLISTSIWGSLTVLTFSIISIFYLVESSKLIRSNVQELTLIENPVEDQFSPKPFGIISLYFLLFLYFFLFGNNGPVSYNFSNFFDSVGLFVPIIIVGLCLVYFLKKKEDMFNNANSLTLLRIFAISLVVSLVFYPWFTVQIVFWALGVLVLIILLDFSINNIKYSHENQITNYIFISYLVMVATIFILLLTELTVLFIIIAGIISYCVIYIYSFKNLKLKSLNFTLSPPNFIFKVYTTSFNLKLRSKSIFLMVLIIIGSFTGILPSFVIISTPTFPNQGIKAMTYNLHFGLDSYGFDNIDRISELIISESPSFIGLQEITFNSPLNGYKNMMDSLRKNLSPFYPYSYYSERQTGFLSNAFFSIYPIVNASTISIEPTVSYQRNFLNLVLDIDGKYLRVVVLHLTHIIEETNPDRVDQANFVLEKIKLLSKLPTIILGDFNAWPEFPETKLFSDKFQDGWNSTNPNLLGFTWPAIDSSQRIDYIFVDNSLTVIDCKLTQISISDHLPLSCDIDF